MPVGASSHETPTTKSGRADGASYHQRLDQLAGEASDMSTKMGGEDRLEAGSRSKPCAAAQRWRRSKPEGEASSEGSEEGRME
jgi:hypothetical protein